MSYKFKIAVTIAFAMLTLTLATSLSIWSVHATERHLRQAAVANSLLTEHLELSVHSYRKFKQLTDEAFLGSEANQSAILNKRAIIAASLDRIRVLELEQRLALGADIAPGAVEDTDDLEKLIYDIADEFKSTFDMPIGPKRTKLIGDILENRIDVSFRAAINAPVERQRRVVDQMNERIDEVQSQLIMLSVVLMILTILGGLIVGWTLIRGIALPLNSLQAATETLAKQDLRHRVAVGFDKEFDQIAESFNQMADRLAQHEQDREQTKRELEMAVEERTTELYEANQALQQADEVRRQFFADVSHELRTPLTVIRGEAQVVLRSKQRAIEDYQEALTVVLEQSIGLSRLVDDMLFIARTDAKRISIRRQPINVSALLADMVREMEQPCQAKNVEIMCDIHSDVTDVLADLDRFRQLLIIMLDNAIRFSPSDSQVQVCVSQTETHTTLLVTDCGPGIDSQDLPYVFERFFRASSDRDNASQGLGLGLAIAKAIVDAHGGDITAQSTLGVGTSIVVRLPKA